MHWYYLTVLWFPVCRFMETSVWQMNTSHRNCVRHYTRRARTKWINFKSWDFRPWPSLVLVFFNATKVLKKSVSGLQRKITSRECQRSVAPSPLLVFTLVLSFLILDFRNLLVLNITFLHTFRNALMIIPENINFILWIWFKSCIMFGKF